jgi:hypothetical protein
MYSIPARWAGCGAVDGALNKIVGQDRTVVICAYFGRGVAGEEEAV